VSRFSRQLTSGQVESAHAAPAINAVERSRPDELYALARGAADGDAEAAATLVLHVGGSMLRVVRKVLGRRHPDVDDVAQDAVIALLSALRTFRGECSVERFSQRVALLTALAARRRMQFRDRHTESDGTPVEEAAAEDSSPLASTVAERRRQLVRQLLGELPDVIGEALAMHFILGHTVEEIASAASVPANTVWSRLRLGKQALRRKLDTDLRLVEALEGVIK
jgi:RNA polymerase sigma-70 factor (ECF subfamily)